MSKKQLVSSVKAEYYLEVEGEDELGHIDDPVVTTITQAVEFAIKAANLSNKRVKLRSMVSLGVFEPELLVVDVLTGE